LVGPTSDLEIAADHNPPAEQVRGPRTHGADIAGIYEARPANRTNARRYGARRHLSRGRDEGGLWRAGRVDGREAITRLGANVHRISKLTLLPRSTTIL